MRNTQSVRHWYNSFAVKQQKVGINLRHYHIMNRIIKTGLRKDHNVLEIGCGIGTLTQLIKGYISKGKIVATDISDESIQLAKEKFSRSNNIELVVSDMSLFKNDLIFDYIILADVLEHIPRSEHKSLFNTISLHMHDESLVCINIPHHKALDFIRSNKPERLQIIDQSLSAAEILKDSDGSGLELIEYISYSLYHNENDYVFMTLKRNSNITLSPISKINIIFRKTILRFSYFFKSL